MSVLILAGLLLVTRAGADARRAVPEALLEQARQDFDAAAVARLQRWQDLLVNLAGAPEAEQLAAVNAFFNAEVPFISDLKHWQQDDYWATPYDILTTAGADCEDYVIAKYYSLRQLGVDTAKLRITYVKAVRLNEAHMVLTYFPTPDAVPLVLDNLINIIAPASKRPDLVPVYSFNAEGMWLERLKGQGILMGNPNKLDLWTDLRLRMQAQGMDL